MTLACARRADRPVGRFLQTDPIGYGDGANIYAYVHGDPVNGTDPSGLDDSILFGVGLTWTIAGGGTGSYSLGLSYDGLRVTDFGLVWTVGGAAGWDVGKGPFITSAPGNLIAQAGDHLVGNTAVSVVASSTDLATGETSLSLQGPEFGTSVQATTTQVATAAQLGSAIVNATIQMLPSSLQQYVQPLPVSAQSTSGETAGDLVSYTVSTVVVVGEQTMTFLQKAGHYAMNFVRSIGGGGNGSSASSGGGSLNDGGIFYSCGRFGEYLCH